MGGMLSLARASAFILVSATWLAVFHAPHGRNRAYEAFGQGTAVRNRARIPGPATNDQRVFIQIRVAASFNLHRKVADQDTRSPHQMAPRAELWAGGVVQGWGVTCSNPWMN